MKTATVFKSYVPGWYEVVTPYDVDFIDDLKFFIKPDDRTWLPVDKLWRIRATELGVLKTLLVNHNFNVEVVDEVQSSGNNLFAQVFDIIPAEYINKVYHALAQAIHPDHGGSVKQMTDLNNAYEHRAQKLR